MHNNNKSECLTILIVEDSPEDREEYQFLLEDIKKYDFTVTETSLAQTGLDLATSNNFDCILLDYNLPDLSGIEFVKELKQKIKEIPPIIILTGAGNENIAVQLMKEGVRDYLIKGNFTAADLEHAIDQAISKAQLEKKLATKEAELEKLVEELKLSNQELENFAYVASHDLKEPIRKINKFSITLKNKYSDQLDDTTRNYIEIISHSSERMIELIQSLLDLARIGTEFELKSVNIKDVVDLALEQLSEKIQETKAKIEIDPNLPEIKIDKSLMAQVFQNLIANSLKFIIDKEPVITIKTSIESSRILISVEDNGIGIEKEQLQNIFKPFKRLVAKNEFEGQGIGLATCQKIIRVHGAEIWAESDGPGQGSQFILCFTIKKLS